MIEKKNLKKKKIPPLNLNYLKEKMEPLEKKIGTLMLCIYSIKNTQK